MDPTKAGLAGKITVIASIVGIAVVLLGGIYNLANTVAGVNDRLDRNLVEIQRLQDRAAVGQARICLAIKQLDNDVRFHVFEEGAKRIPIPKSNVDC